MLARPPEGTAPSAGRAAPALRCAEPPPGASPRAPAGRQRRSEAPRSTVLPAGEPPRGRGLGRARKPRGATRMDERHRRPRAARHTPPAGEGTRLTPRRPPGCPARFPLRPPPPNFPSCSAAAGSAPPPARQPRSLQGPGGRGVAAAAAARAGGLNRGQAPAPAAGWEPAGPASPRGGSHPAGIALAAPTRVPHNPSAVRPCARSERGALAQACHSAGSRRGTVLRETGH